MRTCPGPLTWFDVIGGKPEFGGVTDEDAEALLACSSCDYIIVTGNINDDAHVGTPDLISEKP